MTSQVQRVYNAARQAGPRGICGVDFAAPNVIDGGPPITRLPARIGELEALGCRFRDGGRRQKTKVYVLVFAPRFLAWERGSQAPGAVAVSSVVGAPVLFCDPPRLAIFDDEPVSG